MLLRSNTAIHIIIDLDVNGPFTKNRISILAKPKIKLGEKQLNIPVTFSQV